MSTPAPSCLNCGTPLTGTAYCGQCGQVANLTRLSIGDIWHALIHVFTHADHSVFSLVRDLAYRPGRVAREYVEGRRRKYFNPFTFVIVVVGVASLLLGATRFVDFNQGVPGNPVSDFLQNHINLLILFQVPVLAFFGMLLFRKSQLHFAEHMVLSAYASGFRSIFFTLVVLPGWLLLNLPHTKTVGVYLVVWLLYYAFASAQFHPGNRWWNGVKGFLVGVLSQLLSIAVIWVAFSLWFRLGAK